MHPKGNFHDLDSCVKVSILFKCSSEGTVTSKDMLKLVTWHCEIFGEAAGTILHRSKPVRRGRHNTCEATT